MTSTDLPPSYKCFVGVQDAIANHSPFDSLIQIIIAVEELLLEICDLAGVKHLKEAQSKPGMINILVERGVIPLVAEHHLHLLVRVTRELESVRRRQSLPIQEVELLMRSLAAVFFWYFTTCPYGPQLDEVVATDLLATKHLTRPRTFTSRSVFLSYGKEDAGPVKAMYNTLKARGHQPWMDQVSLLPGQDWQNEVRKAIRQSDIVLACISKKSISKRGFVQKEIRFALEVLQEMPPGRIYLIPIRLEPCEVPDAFANLHFVDLFEPGAWIRLYEAIEKEPGYQERCLEDKNGRT